MLTRTVHTASIDYYCHGAIILIVQTTALSLYTLHKMQANCRSSLRQKKSSSHVQGHTDYPPVLGDSKLDGLVSGKCSMCHNSSGVALMHAGDGM